MAASNTLDCFRECIGKKVVGVLQDGLSAVGRSSTKTLIFDDGTGLTFNSNGCFWQTERGEIEQAREKMRRALADMSREVNEQLALSGSSH